MRHILEHLTPILTILMICLTIICLTAIVCYSYQLSTDKQNDLITSCLAAGKTYQPTQLPGESGTYMVCR